MQISLRGTTLLHVLPDDKTCPHWHDCAIEKFLPLITADIPLCPTDLIDRICFSVGSGTQLRGEFPVLCILPCTFRQLSEILYAATTPLHSLFIKCYMYLSTIVYYSMITQIS